MNRKKWIWIGAAVLALATGWMLLRSDVIPLPGGMTASRTAKDPGAAPLPATEKDGAGLNRGAREVNSPTATHRPERLRDFMLPDVEIRGLQLPEALQKLLSVYQETCAKTREAPLKVRFDIPPGHYKRLTLRLNGKSFKSSVQLLATLSGMKASRIGTVYQFAPLASGTKPISRLIAISPDFQRKLDELAGNAPPSKPTTSPFEESDLPVFRKPPSLEKLVNALGVELDGSTRLSEGQDGTLRLETNQSADAAAITALARTIREEMTMQHRIETKVITMDQLPEWLPADTRDLSDARMKLLIHHVAQTNGAELISMPSVLAKSGHAAAVEIPRNRAVDASSGESQADEPPNAVDFKIRENALGLGHEFNFDFTIRMPHSNANPVQVPYHVKDAGFSADQESRMVVQTRPDGTTWVLLVTSTRIDTEGNPLQ